MKYDRGHMENRLFLDGGAGTWIDIESAWEAIGPTWPMQTKGKRRKEHVPPQEFPEKSLSLPRRSALSLPAVGRGRKVRATQSTTQANDLMAVRSWERNRK